jgi:hypothetical protein
MAIASESARLIPSSSRLLPMRGQRISSTGRMLTRELPKSPDSAAASQLP